jgi:hypothetical protein
VDLASFFGSTVAGIDGELEHVESELEEYVAEVGVAFSVFFGHDGEVEHSEEPHAAILR